MTRRFAKPRQWKPKNPAKYVGKTDNIISRSSWETRLFSYLDSNPAVLFWNSEDVVIKYVSPVDGRIHNYHVDVVAKIRNRHGEEKVYAIEVKPEYQMIPPKMSSTNKKRLTEDIETYSINQAKWAAAKAFFEKQNIIFLVLNEYDIGIAKRKNK